MASVNKVILIGHLGKDPELRYMANGDAVCSISVATSESWTDKASGEKKEQTEWHRCVLFKRIAEVAGEYLSKGSQVFLEGKLKTRKWTDKDGQDKYTTEIHCHELKMLGGKQDGGQSAERRPPAQTNKRATGEKPRAQSFDDMDDDIPF